MPTRTRRPVSSTLPRQLGAAVVFLVMFCVAAPAHAQSPLEHGVPLFGLDYRTTSVPIELEGDGETPDQDNATRIHTATLWAQLPVPLDGKRTILIPRFSYAALVGHLEKDVARGDDLRTVHIVGLGLTLRQALPNRWAILPGLRLGLASDFEGFDQKDLSGGGSLLVLKHVSARLVIGGGVAVTGAADGVLPLPLFLLKWDPRPDLWLSLVLPREVELGYAPTGWLELTLEGALEGMRYTLHGIGAVDQARHVLLSAGPHASVRLGGGLFLKVGGGVSASAVFELNGPGGADTRVRNDMQAEWFVRAALEFRVFPERPE